MAGAHVSSKETDVIYIQQPIGFIADTDEEFLERKDELAKWLNTNKAVPLQFDDEPGRTYYAEIDGTIEDFTKFANQRRGVITFLCADPYGYGEEKTLHFPSDQVIVNNEGTAEADPIFELTATQKTTFAMISNGDEYNLIGQPSDDDVQVVDYKTSVVYENGSTLNEWQHTLDMTMVGNDNNIDSLDGELGTDDAGIRIVKNATPKQKQRGAAIFRELPESIQDFEIESTFDIISRRESENFRTMIYFLDENMNNIGHMGFKDNSQRNKRRVPLAQLGSHNQGVGLIGDSATPLQPAPDTTLLYLRAKREGKRFTFYLAFWRNQKHEVVWERSYNDINNEFQGRLKYITLFIGSYQDRGTPNRNRINSVEVSELTTVEEDQTPYILDVGDVVTFDHKNDDILVNGQVRPDLFTTMGADFFKLKEGYNNLVVTPANSFETKMKYQERFR